MNVFNQDKELVIACRWLDESESRPIQPDELSALLIAGKVVTLAAQVLGVEDKHFDIVYRNGNTLDCRRENLRAVPRTTPS